MASEGEQPLADPTEMTFEAATDELESIIERIEEGAIGLEQSLEARKRGEALIRRCRGVLDEAEQELEQLAPPEDAESGAE
jgi:exodeoxyribonuclease VII small subunit